MDIKYKFNKYNHKFDNSKQINKKYFYLNKMIQYKKLLIERTTGNNQDNIDLNQTQLGGNLIHEIDLINSRLVNDLEPKLDKNTQMLIKVKEFDQTMENIFENYPKYNPSENLYEFYKNIIDESTKLSNILFSVQN